MTNSMKYCLLFIIATTCMMAAIIVRFSDNVFENYRITKSPLPKYRSKHCIKYKQLKQILLAINYNFPHYSSMSLLRETYADIFGKIVFCGTTKHPDVIQIKGSKGYQGYECIATAIRQYPNYGGYMHSNDDVVLNWWNLMKLDFKRIWFGSKLSLKQSHKFGENQLPPWHWWKTANAAHLCEVAFNETERISKTTVGTIYKLKERLNNYYSFTRNEKRCLHNLSDVFYIPSEYAKTYAFLSDIFSKHFVFLEAAVPTILAILQNGKNCINLNGEYFMIKYGYIKKYESGEAFFEVYSFDLTFIHPFKFDKGMKKANMNFYRNVFLYESNLVKRSCLDKFSR